MDIASTLLMNGYAEVSNVTNAEEALRATSMLGDVIPLNGKLLQKLVPKDPEEAASASFSRRYGRDSFPLHTDTAFWAKPARFIVFFMENISRTTTHVLPLQETRRLTDLAKCNNPIFLRHTVEGAIYSRPWLEEVGGCLLYDPCYMQPANQAANAFEAAIAGASARVHQVAWTGKKILIIDNWRVLHGRGSCGNEARILYRFYRGGVNELGT